MNNKQKNQSNSWLDRPILRGMNLNWEQGLYILIIILCLVSRLWMLGVRVQSHDESLHSKYSWNLYTGRGYQHNPMMHGPFLFHATALSYFLFSDSDFTARLPVAIMGTILVAFPYLLRRYLGRGGALTASLLFLISPSISYYSRYIRMDIPSILWAMVILWAVLRYLDEGRERHLYLLAGALSLLYATKEVAAIYTIIFAAFLAGLFIVRALTQRWDHQEVETMFVAALGAVVLGLLLLAVGRGVAGPEGNTTTATTMLVRLGTVLSILGAVAAVAFLLYGLWGQLRTFRSFGLILLIGTLSLPFASPLLIKLAVRLGSLVAERYTASTFWVNLANLDMLNYNAPHIYYTGAILVLTLGISAAIGLAWNRHRWPIAATVYIFIFLIFFTTVFTNGSGIATGWVGSVGYWLKQQGVERGSQPWYYYLVVIPLYDFLPLLGTLAATIYLAVRGVKTLVRRNGDRVLADGQSLAIPFILTWSILTWVGYSAAGERMAWLSVHIATPMILLTGWLLGKLFEAIGWQRVREHRGWLLVLFLPALVAALSTTVQAAISGPFRGAELGALMTTANFVFGLLGLGLLAAAVVWLWKRVGTHHALLLIGLTAFVLLGLLTVRVAYRFSFVNFDRPAEFLVYAHGGSDVRDTIEVLKELSLRVEGGPNLIDVTYGPHGSWPFSWHLRETEFPNARFYGESPSREAVLATAVIAGSEQWSAVEPYLEDDYYSFNKVFLWWPMEDYKRLTWQGIWDWLTDGQKRAALWKIFYNMDYGLYDEITGEQHTPDNWPLRNKYRLYIRKDVANSIWNLGVGPVEEVPPPEEEAETDPYAEAQQSLTPRLTWGTEGSGAGQFSAPRGIAISSDGFVYVADSGNDRIQKFTADGQYVTSWGSSGDCENNPNPNPGTFCEPWGVGVGPDGSVYVADTWAHRIQKFTADGNLVTSWGIFGQRGVDDADGTGYFYGPRDVAMGPDGNVYVTDTGNKRVQVFDEDGEFLYQWGGVGTAVGKLNEPVGIAVDADGLVYVADTWNSRIQVLEANGEPVLSWPVETWVSTGLEDKPYLALDAEGRVYATDTGNYRVLVFENDGTFLYSFGQFGFDTNSFALPTGVAVGPGGSVYVTDATNNRVSVFDPPE